MFIENNVENQVGIKCGAREMTTTYEGTFKVAQVWYRVDVLNRI